MKTDIKLEEMVKERISIRTYEKTAVEEEKKKLLIDYMNSCTNPFEIPVRFELLQKDVGNGEKLGTYGMIAHANLFLAAAVKNIPLGLEALGYSFEKIVLYATFLGLGTCWLGGSFQKGEFSKAIRLKEDELLPVVSPIGYAGKIGMRDRLLRKFVNAENRKPFETMFFENDFMTTLNEGQLSPSEKNALEMLRLAPSAANKQPWKVIKEGNLYHFYEEKSFKESNGIDIQRVDMGIAACHFDLAMAEQGKKGNFYVEQSKSENIQDKYDYIFTWKLN